MDYLKYYDLERYLFDDVCSRFHSEGSISAFDFFSIVIWKANRAKSRIAGRLLDRNRSVSLDDHVRKLTVSLHDASSDKERLRILMMDWRFLLPMASAILTVLWQDEFTVYDSRACGQLGSFSELASLTASDRHSFDRIWERYTEFSQAVRAKAPQGLSLRDGDRFLWGRSAAEQLIQDVRNGFARTAQAS